MTLKLSYKEALKIIKKFPQILSSDISYISKRVDDIVSLGFSKSKALKSIKKLPSILNLSKDKISKRIDDICLLGFKKEEVIEMCYVYPQLLSLLMSKITDRFNNLLTYGFKIEDVINIVLEFPVILGSTIENTNDKLNLYRKFGILNVIVNVPKRLIQSSSLSFARYYYLNSIGIEINEENAFLLFINESNFKKRFKISKKDLLEQFNYEGYLDKEKEKN